VKIQRAAASLTDRRHYLVPGQRQEPHGVGVDVRKEVALDASGEESDAPAPAAECRSELGDRRRAGNVGKERLEHVQHRGSVQHSTALDERPETGPLVEA
jgi:hypothetical protein